MIGNWATHYWMTNDTCHCHNCHVMTGVMLIVFGYTSQCHSDTVPVQNKTMTRLGGHQSPFVSTGTNQSAFPLPISQNHTTLHCWANELITNLYQFILVMAMGHDHEFCIPGPWIDWWIGPEAIYCVLQLPRHTLQVIASTTPQALSRKKRKI